MDNLIDYIQACIKNNTADSEICKMALLAEQALIANENLNDAVTSIAE